MGEDYFVKMLSDENWTIQSVLEDGPYKICWYAGFALYVAVCW